MNKYLPTYAILLFDTSSPIKFKSRVIHYIMPHILGLGSKIFQITHINGVVIWLLVINTLIHHPLMTVPRNWQKIGEVLGCDTIIQIWFLIM